MPLTPPSRFPNFYTMRRGRDEILIRPVDENIRQRDGFLEILAPPAHPKLGIETYAGWFAYLMPNDIAFIKHFRRIVIGHTPRWTGITSRSGTRPIDR